MKNYVFVFGAGVSMDYGLPDMEGLCVKVREILGNPNSFTVQFINDHYSTNFGAQEYMISDCIRKLSDRSTIDKAIKDGDGNLYCIKIAIAEYFLREEKRIKDNWSKYSGCWMNKFLERFEEFNEEGMSRFTFFTFNYDRLFDEHIRRYFFRQNDITASLQDHSSLFPIHLNGDLTLLPGINMGNPYNLEFGYDLDNEKNREYITGIFNDSASELVILNRKKSLKQHDFFKEKIRAADRIIISGISFDKVMLESMDIKRLRREGSEVLASVFKCTKQGIYNAKEHICDSINDNNGLDVFKLLNNELVLDSFLQNSLNR